MDAKIKRHLTVSLAESGPISYERIERYAELCGTTPNNWVQDAIKYFECWLLNTEQVNIKDVLRSEICETERSEI